MRALAAWVLWSVCLFAAAGVPLPARGDDVNVTTNTVQSDHNTVNDQQGSHQVDIGRGSFAGGDGIVTVNQAPGNINNQSNQINLNLFTATARPPLVTGGATTHNASTDNQTKSGDARRSDSIGADAFASFAGLAALNQITGNATGQTNVIGVTVGAGGAVPLSEGDLMAIATRNANDTKITNGVVTDSIHDSAFSGAQGVFAASQSGGDLNQNTNQIGISFHTITLR